MLSSCNFLLSFSVFRLTNSRKSNCYGVRNYYGVRNNSLFFTLTTQLARARDLYRGDLGPDIRLLILTDRGCRKGRLYTISRAFYYYHAPPRGTRYPGDYPSGYQNSHDSSTSDSAMPNSASSWATHAQNSGDMGEFL